MRAVIAVSAFIVLGLGLSGCAVVDVGSAVVSVGANAVGAVADVTGAAVGAVTGGDSDDSDKKKH